MAKMASLALAGAVAMTLAVQADTRADQAKPDAHGVSVTVKYSGKGPVDAKHRLWVWLFENPQIDVGSIPIAEQSIEMNGGTATFPTVAAKQVYVAIAYDEGGGFMGSAPPPSGSPVTFYGAKGPDDPPQAVVPGPQGKISVTFNDSQRMP